MVNNESLRNTEESIRNEPRHSIVAHLAFDREFFFVFRLRMEPVAI